MRGRSKMLYILCLFGSFNTVQGIKHRITLSAWVFPLTMYAGGYESLRLKQIFALPIRDLK